MSLHQNMNKEAVSHSIQILSADVVDQIAAGEVVERPSHMVKELVENAIDAGATEIEVDVSDGGKSLVVKDNGCGIHSSQLKLALARHATSKIGKTDDLWTLSTFGFRGEALASIASVSVLRIISRAGDSEQAYEVTAEYGRLSELRRVGGDAGTTIEISNLFKNVPARLKFLKSDAAEITQIKNCLRALAMAHPEVNFRIRRDGHLEFHWPAGTLSTDSGGDELSKLRQRAEQVLERKTMYAGNYQYEQVRARVVLSPPHETLRSSRQIWIFAQGRWIQDRGLQRAVMDAYRNLLMHGEFPYAVVYVETDPALIDVNIHPAKSQVKFMHADQAFRAVQRAARSVLEQAPWVQSVTGTVQPKTPQSFQRNQNSEINSGTELGFSQANSGTEQQQITFASNDSILEKTQYPQRHTWTAATAKSNVVAAKYARLETGPSPTPGTESTPAQGWRQTLSNAAQVTSRSTESAQEYSVTGESLVIRTSDSHSPIVPDTQKSEQDPGREQINQGTWSQLQLLGQADLTYLVAQTAEGVVFIDQHAAHERVLFERLKKSYEQGGVEQQRFLLPETVQLEEDELEALLQQSEGLSRLGLEIEQLGPNQVGIMAAPAIIRSSALVKVVCQLAAEIVGQGDSFALEKHLADSFATMACHSAIRAGQALSQEQMQSLLVQMEEFQFSSFCPHGRPVFVEYPFRRLERDFGRTV